MKISFVVPAFNEEKNIAACIASIKQEARRVGCDHEIIVANNNSADRTRGIAVKEGAAVIEVPQKGVVFARKAGFEASTGDLVAAIDADNRLPQGWLTTVLDSFSKDPDLIALSGPLIYHDSPLYIRFWAKVFYIVGYLFNDLLKLFGKDALFQGGNYIVRREAIVKSGGYDTSFSFYGEDVDTGRRLALIGKIVWTFKLPMLSSGRRLEEEGVMVTGFKYAMNYLWVVFKGRPFHKRYVDFRP